MCVSSHALLLSVWPPRHRRRWERQRQVLQPPGLQRQPSCSQRPRDAGHARGGMRSTHARGQDVGVRVHTQGWEAGARPEAQWHGCTTGAGSGCTPGGAMRSAPGGGIHQGAGGRSVPRGQGCGCTLCAGCGPRPGAGSTRGGEAGPSRGWEAGARPGVGCTLLKPCRGDCLCSGQSSLSKQILDHGRAGEQWKHSCLSHPYI